MNKIHTSHCHVLVSAKIFQDRKDSKIAREALGPQAAVAQYYHEIMLIESFESLLTRGHAMQRMLWYTQAEEHDVCKGCSKIGLNQHSTKRMKRL